MKGLNTKDPGRKRLPVEIRQMGIDDLPPVFHLGEKVFTAQQWPNLYRSWDEYEVVELFLGDTEFCLVGETGDRIIGFALGTTISKTRSPWKYGHLVWLGVDPGFQRYGVGEKLFKAMTDTMIENGVRILMVDTQLDNLPALDFFRKLGFSNPEEQVYLYLNLDKHKRRRVKRGAKAPQESPSPKRRPTA